MRTITLLALTLSFSAFAESFIRSSVFDLLPLSSVGEGSILTFKEEVIVPANGTEIQFHQIMSREGRSLSVIYCTLSVAHSPRLRRIRANSAFTVQSSAIDQGNLGAFLELGGDTGLSCLASDHTVNAGFPVESITLVNYLENSSQGDNRPPTLLELRQHMPFVVTPGEIDDFSINQDEGAGDEVPASPDQAGEAAAPSTEAVPA